MVLVAGLLLLSSCDHHFYKPLKGTFYHPSEFNLEFEELFFRSPGGERLNGWFFPSKKTPARGAVLHLHGNSANMSNYLFYVAFLAEAGYHLMMFDYRGFGKSTGEPTAEGVLEDSRAALDTLRNRKEVDAENIIVYGQSLGGSIAITMVGRGDRQGVTAVVAEAPFASYRRLAEKKMDEITFLNWFNGVAAQLFVEDRFSPEHFVGGISPVPLLIVHGTDDRVVPFTDGQRLYDLAGKNKTFWKIEGGRHIQMLSKYRSIYRPRLLDYLDDIQGE